jgi:hypothetical protein
MFVLRFVSVILSAGLLAAMAAEASAQDNIPVGAAMNGRLPNEIFGRSAAENAKLSTPAFPVGATLQLVSMEMPSFEAAQLLTELAELTYRKSPKLKTVTNEKLAAEIGFLKDDILYQVTYPDVTNNNIKHVCAAWKSHNAVRNPWRILLFHNNGSELMIYFVDTIPKLNIVLKQQVGSKELSNIPIAEGRDGFNQELDYWNHQKNVLTQETEQRSP